VICQENTTGCDCPEMKVSAAYGLGEEGRIKQ